MISANQPVLIVWSVVVILAIVLSWNLLSSHSSEGNQDGGDSRPLNVRVADLEAKLKKATDLQDDLFERILLLEHMVEHLEGGHSHGGDGEKPKAPSSSQ
jgi:hypothetical protein